MPPFSLSDTQGSEVTPLKPSTINIALALSTVAALAEPLPVPKPPGPGGSCPFGYITRRKLLRRAGRDRQAAERQLPVGMDQLRLVLSSQRERAAMMRGRRSSPRSIARVSRSTKRAHPLRYRVVTCLPRRLGHGRRLGERRRRNEREQEGNGRFDWVDFCLGHYWDTGSDLP